jgi:hypothetical protein
MADRTNKQLLEEVLSEVQDVKKDYSELKDVVTDIDVTLRGTKIQRQMGKGGMAKQVDTNTECIGKIKRRQNMIYAWGSMLVLVINTAFLALISYFKK